MANLAESDTYEAGIYQLERSDAVDAGTSGNGVSNLQPKQLANRTNWLRARILDLLVGGVAGNPVRVARGGLGLDNSAVVANKVPYTSGTGVFSFADSTAYGRSLWNQANAIAASQALNIGLGKFANATTTTQFTTTSTSYQDTGLAVTITPQSTSSQVLVLGFASLRVSRDTNTSAGGYAAIYRGAVSGGTLRGVTKLNVLATGLGNFNSIRTNSAATVATVDAPATSSPVTYRLAIRAEGAGHEITFNNGADTDSFLFALEIIP